MLFLLQVLMLFISGSAFAAVWCKRHISCPGCCGAEPLPESSSAATVHAPSPQIS